MTWLPDNKIMKENHQIRVIFIVCAFITLWLVQIFAMNLVNVQMEVEIEAVIDGNTTLTYPVNYTIENLEIKAKAKFPVYLYDASRLRFWE